MKRPSKRAQLALVAVEFVAVDTQSGSVRAPAPWQSGHTLRALNATLMH